MGELICYVDNEQKGGWARIQLQSGDHCWVEVSRQKIQVKHSNSGFFGVKMYEEKDAERALRAVQQFGCTYPNIAPDEMRHPLLKPIVNTVLHCSSLAEVTRVLNSAGDNRLW